MRLACIRGHHFWPKPITPDSIVVDAGAHRGEYSAGMIRRFGCKCHLVEPNPAFAENLEKVGGASVTISALAGQDGRGRLHISDNPEGSGLFSTDGTITTLAV